MSFESALAFVLKQEGGFVDDPADPGGATNCGITQRVYDANRAARGLAMQSVQTITTDEVRSIYRERYWDAAACSNLPAPIDLIHFDSAVLCGVPTANRMLQQAVGTVIDGNVGPRTIEAVKTGDRWRTIGRYINTRISYHVADVGIHPAKAKFLCGWLRRIGVLLSSV